VDPDNCPNCGGTGFVAKPVDLNGKSEGVAFIRLQCPACAGTGRKRPISPSTAGCPHGPRSLRKTFGTGPSLLSVLRMTVRAERLPTTFVSQIVLTVDQSIWSWDAARPERFRQFLLL